MQKGVSFEERVLLGPRDVKPSARGWKVEGIFNPAAVRLPNGKIALFARVAERPMGGKGKGVKCPLIAGAEGTGGNGGRLSCHSIGREKVLREKDNVVFLKGGMSRLKTISHFRRVLLDKTGFFVESIDEKPSFTGTGTEGQYGVEDAGITRIGNEYFMTYVAVSVNEGVSTSLAASKNLVDWKRKGIIFREQNKDVVLFPEKIKGEFVALHRPESCMGIARPSIWISHSRDMLHWGCEKSIMQPRQGCWDSERVGATKGLFKTGKGWLGLYHGVEKTKRGRVYSAGAFLLGRKNPEKVVARSAREKPLLVPVQEYEKKGFVNNVVFPSQAIPSPDKRHMLVFCGAGDRLVAVKKIEIKEIMESMQFLEE